MLSPGNAGHHKRMKIYSDYQGRAVRLTPERERHIAEHSEMAGLMDELAVALKHPQQVIQSLSDPSVELSYRYYQGTKVGDKWLCVVVKCQPADAFIITAYLTDQLKKGILLWPKR